MKLGMGIYGGSYTADNMRFAKQMSCSHIVAHLPSESDFPSTKEGVWSYDDLSRLKNFINSYGLEMAAIENFNPRHIDKILLGLPEREQQIELVKQTIRNMGKAGIPVMGYYFSIAGVWGRTEHSNGRGGAGTLGYDADLVKDAPAIPKGEIWGHTLEAGHAETIGTITREQMWDNLTYFLTELVPVAEEAGVRLAAHPDDPPLTMLRHTGRLICHPDDYKRLLAIVPSHYNSLEFCQGTITEMGVNVYEAIEYFAGRKNISYVHFRNVRGSLPRYDEVFIDEGDVDMMKAIRLYHENGFDGVLIPDHTPLTSCAAPWHAGIAYALGFMRAAMRAAGAEEK